MKQIYPEYRKEGITAEHIYSKLINSEQKIINDFITLCAGSAGENKLKDIKATIVQFRDIIEKKFDDLTIDDLRKYLAVLNNSDKTAYTTNGIKVHIKRFLKWKFKDWNIRFDELKDIKLSSNPFNKKKINEDSLLTKEEVEKMIRACLSLRDKALLMVLIESGARPIEIRELKWLDVKFKEPLTEIILYSKKNRESRKAFLKEATIHLKRWREEYSYPNRVEKDYVFPSPFNRNKPLTRGAVTFWFKSVAKRAGIQRNVFPYLARHTLATTLYKKIPGVLSAKAMGHNQDMSQVYAHLSSDDLKEALLSQIYHIEEIPAEKKQELEQRIKRLEEFIKKTTLGKKIIVSKKNSSGKWKDKEIDVP